MPNLFMIDLETTHVLPQEKIILQHPQVGAVLLFTRNFHDKNQLKQLTDAIKAIRADLFIAVDHEGGAIQRFQRQGFFPAPAVKVFGDTYDLHAETGVNLTKQYSQLIAEELLSSGIDLNFAPILDVHDAQSTIIGQLGRAFHARPEVITILAAAFIEMMHAVGMPAVGKHFPGHGRCSGDSHIEHPTNADTLATIRQYDLKPFIDLIQDNQLDAVMAAHVLYPDVDNQHVAGFSKRWLQDILRQELNFKGLIFSDCLSMQGASLKHTKNDDMAARANAAMAAGCDMLILCNQNRPELQQFLETNQFAQSPESIARIDTFKQSMRRFRSL